MVLEFAPHFVFKSEVLLIVGIIPNGELELLGTTVLVVDVQVDALEEIGIDFDYCLHADRFELEAVMLSIVKFSEIESWRQELPLVQIGRPCH